VSESLGQPLGRQGWPNTELEFLQSTGFTFEDADNGSVSDGKVDDGEEGAEHFANLKRAEHSADE
jgi:hypothetical protein